MLCKKLLLSLLLTLLATAPVAAETLKIGLNYPQTGRRACNNAWAPSWPSMKSTRPAASWAAKWNW